MDYKVLTVQSDKRSEAECELEKKVKKYLSLGWTLNGSISIAVSTYGHKDYYTLAQAMVK